MCDVTGWGEMSIVYWPVRSRALPRPLGSTQPVPLGRLDSLKHFASKVSTPSSVSLFGQ